MRARIAGAGISDRLRTSRVIAVLRAAAVDALLPVCDVLVEEEILSLEFTLTTPGLLDRLPELVGRYTGSADVGVGTVLTATDTERAIDGGSRYLVTPNMNMSVIDVAVRRGVAIYPGGLTPTELWSGW